MNPVVFQVQIFMNIIFICTGYEDFVVVTYYLITIKMSLYRTSS